MEFDTRLLHGVEVNKYAFGSTQPVLSQANSYAYSSMEELEKVFNHLAPGVTYSRVNNPTVHAFEKRIMELEGGVSAVACASGMSAISISLANLLLPGDEIIVSSSLFGGSIEIFSELKNTGITVNFVKNLTVANIKNLINKNTKLLFSEIIANTSLDVLDVESVANLAHEYNIPLIVDATTCSPYLCRAIEKGADVVIHSTSKYINGMGNAIGGIIIDSGKFAWDFDKFKSLKRYEEYKNFAYTAKLFQETWRNAGACMAPFNAYLSILGLETLAIRMERICANALKIAEALDNIEGIEVTYPSLPNSIYYQLSKKQFSGLGGGIVTIRVGSKEKAFKFINSLKYATIATNLGDVRTLVISPRTTIFRNLTDEECSNNGVYEDTIRICVGIENPCDLVSDFLNAANIALEK